MGKECFLKILFLLFIIAITLITCRKEEQMTFNKNDLSRLDISQEQLDQLKAKRILFGHQSVGNNILDGIKKLMECNLGLHLTIQEVNSPDVFDQPLFGHFSVGRNTDPKSKCDSFKKIMDSGIGDNVDIAFFKFCYVDINNNTDIYELFDYYVKTIEHLKTQYPKAIFIHVTVPLTTTPHNLKGKIKSNIRRILGRPNQFYISTKRNNYNKLLSRKYHGKDPIYDLASIESTLPDGYQYTFFYNGETYKSLAPMYTHDGGHLNDLGQIIVAKSLIRFLCDLI